MTDKLDAPFDEENDPQDPFLHEALRSLLGLAAHPEDPSRACAASGQDTWESYIGGLEMACRQGWCAQRGWQTFTITWHGRMRGQQAIAAEQARRDAGLLTRRDASRCHADLIYQHMIGFGHPLERKLWALMHTDGPFEPLTAQESRLLAAHIEMQTGPDEQDLIDRLQGVAD